MMRLLDGRCSAAGGIDKFAELMDRNLRVSFLVWVGISRRPGLRLESGEPLAN
jgi:hypothetical protein